jgi:cell wall-associated NlpC family hydrolase
VRKKDTAETEKPEGYNGLVKAAFTVIRSSPSQKAPTVFPVSIGTRFLVTGEMKSFFEVALPKKRSGWVTKKDVMKVDGGRTTAVEVRAKDLVRVARLFLGTPYLWGGRSMQMPWTVGPVMGVDCSGLVNLVFRANNLDVPRDAHEQWMTAKPIALSDLGPGDLIFVSREDDPPSINHVMLSLGAEKFIEATETGDIVRIRTFGEKFGCDLGQVQSEAPAINGKHLHFGRMNTGKNG